MPRDGLIPPAGEWKLSPKPFSKGLRSLEAEPQVAARKPRNSPLKPGVRPGFQSKHTKRERPSERRSFQRLRDLRVALFFSILVDSGQKTGIKRGFRVLRDTTQGSALRTCSLLKKAGENFISPAGGTTLNLFPRLSPRPACGTKSFIFPIQKDFTMQQLTNTSIAV